MYIMYNCYLTRMQNFFISLLLVCLIHDCSSQAPNYLLYSVNLGEGFNLRRDVHMRAATLVKELRDSGIIIR